jgi:hypothetical protein
MHSNLLEYVIVTEFQVTDIFSSSDLTKAKYRIGRVPMMEKEEVILRINTTNFISGEKRIYENEVYSQFVHRNS